MRDIKEPKNEIMKQPAERKSTDFTGTIKTRKDQAKEIDDCDELSGKQKEVQSHIWITLFQLKVSTY